MLMLEEQTDRSSRGRIPWNKGKLIGQKPPLKMKEVWRVRFQLQQNPDVRGPGTVRSSHRQQAQGM